jgi:predicted cupin superfamily sugar epimerase
MRIKGNIADTRGDTMITVEELITLLNLTPPPEGGYYRESYRSGKTIPNNALPRRYKGDRAYSTAIYYLLTPDTFSSLHRLGTDEVYHFYLGDPVEMLQLLPEGRGKVIRLGDEIKNGMHLQVAVPRGTWQGSRLIPDGKCALLGTTVAPGFEFADFEIGRRNELLLSHPRFRDLIVALTRE